MLALGLDPSLTGFGWCIFNSEGVGPSRVIGRGVFKTLAKEVFVSRYMALREHVRTLLRKYPEVKVLGIESPPFGEQFSEGLYGLFLYVNEAVYTERRDVVYFDPGTVKLLTKEDKTVRKGKMFKTDMVDSAKLDTGIAKWNHNEADAYHIGRYAARFWMLKGGHLKDSDLTPSELHSFTRVKTFSKGKHAGETRRDGLIYRENDRYHCFSKIPELSK